MVLDQRRTSILNLIYQSNGAVSIDLLKERLGVSQRTIYYDIDQINGWLEREGLSPVEKAYGKGFYLSERTRDHLASRLKLTDEWEYRLSRQERICIILISLLTQSETSSLHDLMERTQVSRGTIFRDIKKAADSINPLGITLSYEKGSGYELIGSEQAKRQLLTTLISDVLSSKDSRHLHEKLYEMLNPSSGNTDDRLLIFLENEVASIEKKLNVSFTEEVVQFLILQLLIVVKRKSDNSTVSIDEEEMNILEKTNAYQAVEELNDELKKNGFHTLPFHERLLLTMQLLGSRVHREHIASAGTKEIKQLQMVIKKIIDDFQLIGCLIFDDRKQLEENLLTHLKPAYYRLKYSIPITNSYLKDIQKQYPEVFYLTKRSLSHLESFVGKTIPDEEIAYVAMHFGGWLSRKNQYVSKNYKAIVVCENGIAASGMLRSQLETLLPEMMVTHTVSVREYNRNPFDADIVFSTSFIKQKWAPVIYVPALLDEKDRENVVQQVRNLFNDAEPAIEIDLLMAMIEEHAIIKQREPLKEKLQHFISSHHSLKKEAHKPMLDELLTEETIQFRKELSNWEEAIQLASAPLLANESIKPSYVEAMVKNVQELGPYVVIAPNIAIPHARPEYGVDKLGMSFLRVKSPVSFSNQEKHKASLIIVLAAIDNETHLKALSQLTELLSEPGNTEKLIQAETAEDVLSLVKKYSLK
ncbi:BglG family transcription antiterminator [Bacillus capparidis]|uniref:Transcriptional antiterminator/mannitol/fructose-specific phosphotransferase system IIA component (Ntr-type) n=1 Tax=Bacillus capparidis TaxID=1840411 RepID=A0ABS4CZ24_9BACI|nr:BglG family transcription antiterminator [Bacillus capparidis]MBP1082602.1 transcriptional antiterminator/mannitol/fructose-specific phosphotransferase system IIA component (Ntr-type) [Bacillus capparidis]MED1097169.1 BglG family transcription antiterminator [Bacillus capparidis]